MKGELNKFLFLNKNEQIMLTEMDSTTMEICDSQTVELYIEPIKDDFAKEILDTISLDKVYLTRINHLEVDLTIVKKSTPLFTYSLVDELDESDVSEDLEDDFTPGRSFININSDYRDERSNIIQSGKDYIASEDGLFIIYDGQPKIVPVSLDGSSNVRVSEDSMSVFVDVFPSIDDNPITTLDAIVSKIIKIGVVTDIKTAFLADKLKEVEVNKKKFLNLIVSEGKPAVDGVDGRLENCTNKKAKFKNFDFGEFHKVNPVISVKEDETIAILHPPTNGEYGYNVLGETLEPKPGKVFVLKVGPNASYSEENETHIIAKKDGFVNMSDSSISITDTFTVRGDIDFESGNIISKGSLKVVGCVKNEFTLSLTKDIEIGGYVGDATIESGQNITIRGGFLGKGKGKITAKGDIEVKFVENQSVYSRGSLLLAKDTLNAKLFVKNKIFSKGHRSSIIGGHAIAGESIEIYSLGNDSHTETIVEVGFDYLKRNSIVENKEKTTLLRENLEQVDKNILEFAKMKRLNTQGVEKLKLLGAEHKQIVAEIEKIKEQNLVITSEIYVPTSSRVSVNGPIHPGVKIGINGRFFIVNEPMMSKTFVLSKDNEVIAV